MDSYKASQVISGTWGEMWLSGEKMAECTSLQAKVSLKKTAVSMCGTLVDGQKITGIDCKGTLKLNKVTSMMISLLSSDIRAGKQSEFTIMSKLADPDALGTERITLKGVTFDELTLIDWDAKKNGEESIPFTFQDWEPLDLID
ncbi:phage tail tube protein [Clostridium magnum]|uniref:Phage-like element PBSX protein XkdM n=1 Tax=Clostridium magnum DSM 2767 TaxID=1121326 RepID=A0A161X4A2_9CLOT|nr:phage tail tube protein [Clostridium magnum]KZL94368.1 phage-like element PBSX protein XkdM [Clostridium magnum DSM 2767]SHJ49878.1 Phage tail tube protein [Clostridium magnum DSM 2767]